MTGGPAAPPVRSWSFRVEGACAPKGSVSAFPIKTKKGTRAVVTHSDDSKATQQAVKEAATRAQPPDIAELRELPCVVTCDFYLPAPKWVKEKRRQSKRKRGAEPYHRTRPDTDKMVRTVLDGLEAVAYDNDAQVFGEPGFKWYTPADDTPHTDILIEYFPPQVELPEPKPAAQPPFLDSL